MLSWLKLVPKKLRNVSFSDGRLLFLFGENRIPRWLVTADKFINHYKIEVFNNHQLNENRHWPFHLHSVRNSVHFFIYYGKFVHFVFIFLHQLWIIISPIKHHIFPLTRLILSLSLTSPEAPFTMVFFCSTWPFSGCTADFYEHISLAVQLVPEESHRALQFPKCARFLLHAILERDVKASVQKELS